MKRISFPTMALGKTIITGILMASFAWGRVDLLVKDSTVDLGISSADWIQFGQIVDGYSLGSQEVFHLWLQQTFLDLAVDATIKERLRIGAGLEGEMWLNTPKGGASSQQYYIWRLNSSYTIDKAYGEYLWGDTASPFLSLTFGKFHYKYDPDARNLGEYLFRSGTYPAYLINNFDLPYARLTGFKLSSDLFNMLHQDLMLTFETDIPPYNDLSLSYILNCSVGKTLSCGEFLQVGAGVEFAHLISVDSQTTPINTRSKYTIGSDTTSHYYTFRGTKLMGRLSLNPLAFFKSTRVGRLFGKEDLKIYGEAAILGLESYPKNDSINSTTTTHNNIWGYDTLKNKIPFLIGFNWPTHPLMSYTLIPLAAVGVLDNNDFKKHTAAVTAEAVGAGIVAGAGSWLLEKYMKKNLHLDVLSVEAEWYGCMYPNNFANELGKGNLQSLPIPDFYDRNDYGYANEDNWKVSVYMKKMLFNDHFGMVLQIARDHMRLESMLDEAKYSELEESLQQKRMWAWMFKLVAQF